MLLTKGAQFSRGEKLAKCAIVSLVILLPVLVYLLIANARFKIGG